ncbi:copper chaperone PCu(A)C [Helicobacter equorum]|uniref:copper chaperone PCu(A)C n=1 Tax=Helicobacter equorum TaxID=361872 RepID=UPI000CF1071D|nr:copper chaperone PCu(A)C [Helicobacter equorum]
MKFIKKILLCVGMLSCFGANAADIEVADVFVQFVPHNSKAAAAFMRIHNNTDKDIALVGGKSAISENTEFHTHIYKDGMKKMVQVPEILVKAYGDVNLEPGGYHVMFINLIEPLKEGQKVSFSLQFSNGNTIELKDIGVIEAKGHTKHTHH